MIVFVFYSLLLLANAERPSYFNQAQDELTAAAYGLSDNQQRFSLNRRDNSRLQTLLKRGLPKLDRRNQDVAIAEAKEFSALAKLQQKQAQLDAERSELESRRNGFSRRRMAVTKPSDCTGCCQVIFDMANRRDMCVLPDYGSSPTQAADYYVGFIQGLNQKLTKLTQVQRMLNGQNKVVMDESDVMIKELGSACDCNKNAMLVTRILMGKLRTDKFDTTSVSLSLSKKQDLQTTFKTFSALNADKAMWIRETCTDPYHGFVIQQTKSTTKDAQKFRIYSAFASTFRLIDWMTGFDTSIFEGLPLSQKILVPGNKLLTKTEMDAWFDKLMDLYDQKLAESVCTAEWAEKPKMDPKKPQSATNKDYVCPFEKWNSNIYKVFTTDEMYTSLWGANGFRSFQRLYDESSDKASPDCTMDLKIADWTDQGCTANWAALIDPLTAALTKADKALPTFAASAALKFDSTEKPPAAKK